MKNECFFFFDLSTYVFSDVNLFVLSISSFIVVKYSVLKSFIDHIHGSERSYAQ